MNSETLKAWAHWFTGATSGIGRAAAHGLGRHGAEVVVHGRDAARGSAVVDKITAECGNARFVAADLSDPAQLDGLAEQPARSTSWSTTPASPGSGRRQNST